MPSSETLQAVFGEFRGVALPHGSELLFRPGDALSLLDEIESSRFVVLGVDTRRCVDGEKGWIVQRLDHPRRGRGS